MSKDILNKYLAAAKAESEYLKQLFLSDASGNKRATTLEATRILWELNEATIAAKLLWHQQIGAVASFE